MPIYNVKVKWGKQTFTDVELNTDEEPMVFKAQLFALTGVQPFRQKVMLKGQTLKDNDWEGVPVKESVMLLMMGSKDEDALVEPQVKPVFIEDMDEDEIAAALQMPAGLTNLGNTCYMNATVQCLKTVPELRDVLKEFRGSIAMSPTTVSAESVTAALRDLYGTMDRGSTVPPLILLQILHWAFPRFAEKTDNGSYMQQDANECWTEVVRMLQQKLKAKKDGDSEVNTFSSFIDQYFGGTFNVELKCTESEEEPVSYTTENFLQLSCFISTDVRYMHSGLRNKLQEHITKSSTTLCRDAVFNRTSKISRLPAYLTVQFVRFYYKEKEAINAKILKDVKFPMSFDAFDLCTSELQEKLTPMRTKFKDAEDKKVEESQISLEKDRKSLAQKEEKDEPPKKTEPFWFQDDVGSNNSGYYELQAVLTHRGRSSSSGHYVAWVRHNTKKGVWLKCDDDTVTAVTEEEILKLSGGGDWHCAYLLLYGPRMFEIEADPKSNTASTSDTVMESVS